MRKKLPTFVEIVKASLQPSEKKIRGIQVQNVRIDKKTGKLVKFQKLDASAKIRQRKSKKVRVSKQQGTAP